MSPQGPSVPFRRRRYALLALSGAGLVAGFPPINVALVPFVALVPLFVFLETAPSIREIALGSLAFAAPFYLGVIGWLFLLTRFTPAGFLAALAVYVLHLGTFAFVPASIVLLRRGGRLPLALAAPFAWVIAEHARTFGDLNFPWATLGASLTAWPALIQHADLVGVWGLSLWIALVNALAATAYLSWRRSPRARNAALAAIAVALAVPLAYGAVRERTITAEVRAAPRMRVAVVQPDIPQSLKWAAAARDANLAALNQGIADAERGSPDLVVGPEACLPMIVKDGETRLPQAVAAGSRPLLMGVVRGVGALVPVTEGGVSGFRYERHRNSAVLAGPDRTIVAVHDKAILVPMTEAIPFHEVLGFILPLMRRQFGRFEPGDHPVPLVLATDRGPVRLGALVCFEILHEYEVRDLARDGVDAFVNVTNDAWFGRSNMPFQHAGLAVLRAIETRRSVVRAANTGISEIVDASGRVSAVLGLDRRGVLEGDVPLLRKPSFFVRHGAAVLPLIYGAAFAVFTAGWWRSWRRRLASARG